MLLDSRGKPFRKVFRLHVSVKICHDACERYRSMINSGHISFRNILKMFVKFRYIVFNTLRIDFKFR